MAPPSTPRKKSLYEPFHRVFRAVVELFAHLIVVGSLLGGIKLIEKLVHSLWGTDYLFFERIKLKYIFDGADLAILVGFLLWGVYLVIAAYVRKLE